MILQFESTGLIAMQFLNIRVTVVTIITASSFLFAITSLADNRVINAARHVGQARASADVCPTLSYNRKAAVILAATMNIRYRRFEPGGTQYLFVVKAYEETKLAFERDPQRSVQSAACYGGEALYGPNGINVPELLLVVDGE